MKLKFTLKTSTKLILSYTLIVIITCITGYAGFYVMKEIQKQQVISHNAIKIVSNLSNAELQMYKYFNENNKGNQ